MENQFENLNFDGEFKLNETPLITIAFIGDAVHTLMIRNYFLSQNILVSNNLHTVSSKFCSAKKQALALEILKPNLNEFECDLVRRTRNSKTHKPPKNCDLEIYKKATSFEVLFGFWYLTKNLARLNEMFNIIMLKEKLC